MVTHMACGISVTCHPAKLTFHPYSTKASTRFSDTRMQYLELVNDFYYNLRKHFFTACIVLKPATTTDGFAEK